MAAGDSVWPPTAAQITNAIRAREQAGRDEPQAPPAAADLAERRRNGPAGPRRATKGSRKHCSTHAERREDCYRCVTEGCF